MIGATLSQVRAALLGALVGLSACAAPAPTIDPRAVLAEGFAQGRRVLRESLAARSRLADLDLTLSAAAAEFCGSAVRPKLGGVVGSRESFSGRMARAVASSALALGDGVSVAHVTPGGPLDEAGIRRGDQIVAIDGVPVATNDALSRQVAAAEGAIELRIRRGPARLTSTVVPAQVCPITLAFAASPALLPWQPEPRVGATPMGLMRLLHDDELAIVLAHQVAHLLFDRAEDDALTSERRADRIGLFLAARGGYDVGRGMTAWERIAAEYPWIISEPSRGDGFAAYPHQALALRSEGIRETTARILELQAQGLPLVPAGD